MGQFKKLDTDMQETLSIERAKELILIAENTGNMFPSEEVKALNRETEEERKAILAYWRALPGYFTYIGTLRHYIESQVKG